MPKKKTWWNKKLKFGQKFWRGFTRQQKHGIYLIFSGVLLVLVFASWRWHESRILAFNRQFEVVETSGVAPVAIKIPKVNIDLAVTEATITDNTWEISATGASHWDNSANPGEGGNIVIYGHNKTNLFGPIRWVSPGEIIEVTGADGKVYEYKITETVITEPNDVAYVLPKDKETLTLYTCTGLFDSKRYIVVAEPYNEPLN
ncbi:MAG: Peptidase C60 sortase A and B [Candidatus Beckwithbacteria bacterium GW2011_GWB1_47_15]|uniref:Peptidase C60 sortase A and B n=1 Tax=Candidatus Beckwithbacteria bacterium GW2011_GWB1_47_15 TaxID=1618371 RepID=A0A0G1RT09_9BACT|nr:MAG: peptidase C60 sortase A and B [Candidatus Beckwithbacteria bacterium GW2011_GWC1_49_16]AQS30956.1 hypothetical protein [uncultured bacterium]KKU34876.1 MAG: Peptidase C60 sortase A and B [Candidatus Beckwithbacteria bacterium GW2011_GWA1_46_30]KKU60469.1 MAG: Peptidase C60 sortase A and B [Candidatus Beckwithbacteria bacterium GW2011_GWB1_47_15]KKU72345.1 MAG: Peptidase C60 sortase A and B [Candidatus Beckwithbacteria bacterium GW2011_GWA2_47_25]OGD48237.1 MAG: hypothetical protein A28